MKITAEIVAKASRELEEYTGNIWTYSDTYLKLWRFVNKQKKKRKYKPRDAVLEQILYDNLYELGA